jgi:hypothetical protein
MKEKWSCGHTFEYEPKQKSNFKWGVISIVGVLVLILLNFIACFGLNIKINNPTDLTVLIVYIFEIVLDLICFGLFLSFFHRKNKIKTDSNNYILEHHSLFKDFCFICST